MGRGADPIRIVLADDHDMVREGLAQMLAREADFEVLGQASTGRQAVLLCARLHPDVVVLDYSLPDLDGAEVARQIADAGGDAAVVVLSVHENVHYAMNAMQCGARAYVVKTQSIDELGEAIRSVHAGRTFVSPTLASQVAENLSAPARQRPTIDRLSRREFELLRLLGRGHALKDCAKLMHISESTASTYRQRIVGKLGLDSTASLIRFALQHGIDG